MSVSEWDSLGALMFMSRLEEDRGIIVRAEEMARLNWVRKICNILEMHKFRSR